MICHIFADYYEKKIFNVHFNYLHISFDKFRSFANKLNPHILSFLPFKKEEYNLCKIHKNSKDYHRYSDYHP